MLPTSANSFVKPTINITNLIIVIYISLALQSSS